MKPPKITTTVHLDWLEHRVLYMALKDAQESYKQQLKVLKEKQQWPEFRRLEDYIQLVDALTAPIEFASCIMIAHKDS